MDLKKETNVKEIMLAFEKNVDNCKFKIQIYAVN